MPRATSPGQPTPKERRRRVETAGFVAVGRVVAPWGVRGDIKVVPLTDFPQRFERGSTLWLEGRPLQVRRSRWHRQHVYLGLEGVADRREAEALRDGILEVPETDLMPLGEGRYYRFQLIGLEVFASDGRRLGRLEEVLPTGADDVFVVRGQGGEVLLPAVADVVREVDLSARRMVVEPMDVL